jgi:hypothetical protein
MKVNTDVLMVYVAVVAVISAIFVGIMNSSGMDGAAPWGIGFAAAYILFKKRSSGNG